MTHPPSRIAIIVAYFLIYVVWGSTYYFIGVCLRDFPPFVLGTLRFVVVGTILLVACKMRGELLFRRGLILKSAVCGIILLFVDQGVIMFAQRYVSSSLVAIMASSTAVWIMLLDVPQWRRNFRSVSTVAGIVLGFIGVAMLYLEQLNMQRPGGSHYEYGVLLLIGGCISWACGTLYSKYHIRDNGDEGGLASSADARCRYCVCLMCRIVGRFQPFAALRSVLRFMAVIILSHSLRLNDGLHGIHLAVACSSRHRSCHSCLCKSRSSRSHRCRSRS